MRQIAVIGRSNFETGIGCHSYAFLELLSQNFGDVGFYSTSERDKDAKFIQLPSGRYVQKLNSLDGYPVRIFCDVLKNSKLDYNYKLVEGGSLKIAFVVFDSSQIPAEWTTILNDTFDVVLAPDLSVINAMITSGVTIPSSVLPLALDLNSLLRKPLLPVKPIVHFGSLSAYHPRKHHLRLIKAFLNVFPKPGDAQLSISSNLNFENEHAKLLEYRNSVDAEHVQLHIRQLPTSEKDKFLQSLDVYCSASAGEGYAIPPREALALGKPLILSNTGAHQSLNNIPGVYLVNASISTPAFYPEIDNSVFGSQAACDIDDLSKAIEQTFSRARSGELDATMNDRRWQARTYDFVNLFADYAEAVNADEAKFRKVNFPKVQTYKDKINSLIGPYLSKLHHKDRRIVVGHDGGFFSVYNTYLSHLHWDLKDPTLRLCLPDWSIDGIRSRFQLSGFTSFCYGRPEDGNIWNKLFIPPFGLDAEHLNDHDFLYSKSRNVDYIYNELREPQLTYKHAYRLYGSPDFQRWRQSYHNTFKEHVQLLPALQAELDYECSKIFDGSLVIGAHVRHASHAMEQPDGRIASGENYIANIHQILQNRFGSFPEKEDWRVFLATDQEAVINRFKIEFGERLFCYGDVKRTKLTDDANYLNLDKESALKEGHQIQHLTAQNPDAWNWKMAWEVIRDTYTLARCDYLLHITSNISTAVSYINPKCTLIYCSDNL